MEKKKTAPIIDKRIQCGLRCIKSKLCIQQNSDLKVERNCAETTLVKCNKRFASYNLSISRRMIHIATHFRCRLIYTSKYTQYTLFRELGSKSSQIRSTNENTTPKEHFPFEQAPLATPMSLLVLPPPSVWLLELLHYQPSAPRSFPQAPS